MIFVKQLTVISYLGEQHCPQSYHTEQGQGCQQCAELCQDRGRREKTDLQGEGPGVADMLLVDLKSGPGEGVLAPGPLLCPHPPA